MASHPSRYLAIGPDVMHDVRMRLALVACLICIPVLVACGVLDDEWPECGDIWEQGQTVPDTYRGCAENGHETPAVWHECADGTKVFTYGDDWYTRNGVVFDDSEWDVAVRDCGGSMKPIYEP